MAKDAASVRQSVEEMIAFLTGIREEIDAGTYTPEDAAGDVFHLENGGFDFFTALEWYAEQEGEEEEEA